jgi:HK97 family phage portal protein
MGRFRNVMHSLFETRSLDNPAVPLTSFAAWESMFGGGPTASGEIINENNAIKLVTVYGCVKTIAESVASLPLTVMKRTATGHQEATDNPLYYLLSVSPNPEMTAYTFIENMIGSLAYTGNSYAEIERNPINKQPMYLWPLHPFKTTPKRDPITRKIFYETSDGMPNGQVRRIPSEDILHMPLFSFDGLKGLSPIDQCRQSFGLAMALEKAGAKQFGNGSVPPGIMFNKGPKPDPAVQQKIAESWSRQQGGDNQGKMPFMFGEEWSYQQIGLSNEASQWIQSKAFTRADIAMGIFRVPPHMIGDNSKLSGSNAEQLSLQFATFCLQPYLSRFENEIVRKLMPNNGITANQYFVKFSVDSLLRCDFKTQQDGYQAGIIGGWYNPNDVLRALGRNPGPAELNVYRAPVNYQNAKRLLDANTPLDDATNETKNDDVEDGIPTQQERNMFGAYTNAYLTLYKDAFTRFVSHKNKDIRSITTIFSPIYQSIAGMAVANMSGQQRSLLDMHDDIVTDALKSMSKRTVKWPSEIEDINTFMVAEFNKTVRSIHIAVARQEAGKKAIEQLTPTQNEDEASDE